MKKYFTKYLPVEGEIKKVGDLVRNRLTGETPIPILGEDDPDIRDDNFQKVKLFLCSRDIQVHDKVIYLPDNTEREVISEEEFRKDVYRPGEWCLLERAKQENIHVKRIGEISPEATWVKEGMEFDEEEVCIRFTNMHRTLISDLFEDFTEARLKEYNLWSIRLGIKGPCGHFH